MPKTQYDDILEVACYAGCVMLQSGGEIYRVEETMSHIAGAYGVQTCDSYATPTTIMLTIHDEDGKPYTTMKRILERQVDLFKIELINGVSRRLEEEQWDIATTHSAILAIDQSAPQGRWVRVGASAVATGAFAVVFGGGLAECLCGLFCGALLRLCLDALNRLKLGAFFVNLTGGAMAALMGWLLYALGLTGDFRLVTLATLMLMVPGMLFTNGFRDMVAGDLVSGISRGIEALCIAVALAGGASIVYTLLAAGGVNLW